MRLFIAIPLSAKIKTALQNIQQTLPKGVRKQPVEQMHITLRFLGETPQAIAQKVESYLDEIRADAFTLRTNGVGIFPQKGKPKIIWVDVEKNETLMNLHQKIEEVCVKNGFEPEKPTYIPHITLGKVKKTSARDAKSWVENEGQGINLISRIDSFILYESVFNIGGVNHKTVKKYLLRETQ